MKKYLPLFFIESYLLITLAIFYIGPVNFKIHNQGTFIALMILYHAFFICGYWLATRTSGSLKINTTAPFQRRFYYISFVIGLIGVIGSYNNLMLSTTFIPYNFFNDLGRGLMEPGLAYTDRMIQMESGITSDSRLFNIASLFFSFFKLFFIFKFVYFWTSLGTFQKLLAVIYSFLFVSSGISAGTNSVIFIFFIFLIFSVITTLYIQDYSHLGKVMAILAVIFLIPISSFGYIMSQRGGGFDYFANSSPLGDISVSTSFSLTDNANFLDFLFYSFVWLNYYVVQGYYGFSLILNLDHNWTFGFGNSAFLQRQLLMVTDIDISKLTFQSRISQYWDESAQWHSFYGQFANDFGLIGLTLFMFLIGYYVAKIWNSIIFKNSFYGAALMPIFIIMFIFFPANNQVFAYIDTLSYFIIVSFFWIFEKKKVEFIRHV